MLKDIIEEAQEKAINKLAQYLPDNHKVEEAYQSLDLVIAQTAQIVAREVLKDVVNTLDNCRWDADPRHMSPEQMAHNTTVYECIDKVLKTKITI
jgi:hypothetical protein